MRHKDHTNLPLGRERKGVGRGSEKASQRRWFDHVFTQVVSYLSLEDLILFKANSEANSPQNVPFSPGKHCTLHFSYSLYYIVLYNRYVCVCVYKIINSLVEDVVLLDIFTFPTRPRMLLTHTVYSVNAC